MGKDVVVPPGQVDELVAPVPENMRMIETPTLSFGVEHRELNARVIVETYGHDPEVMKFFESMMDIDDVGITLHVYSRDDMRERLRFDAFGDHPHYHYVFPDGSHLKMDYDVDAFGDLFEWTLGSLETRLAHMLRRAGAADVADRLDADELRSVGDDIARVAADLRREHGRSTG